MAVETLPEPTIPDHHAAAAEARISDGDADHRRRHDLPRAGDCVGRARALAFAARSPAARAGTAAETSKRAILARHRRLRPRRAVADSLRRTDIAVDRPRRRRLLDRHWACDRPRLRLLQMDRCGHDADHGRADGDPEHPARHRRGVAVGREPDDGADRHHHPRNSAGGAAGAIGGAVGARGALCRGRDFGRLVACRKSCGGI